MCVCVCALLYYLRIRLHNVYSLHSESSTLTEHRQQLQSSVLSGCVQAQYWASVKQLAVCASCHGHTSWSLDKELHLNISHTFPALMAHMPSHLTCAIDALITLPYKMTGVQTQDQLMWSECTLWPCCPLCVDRTGTKVTRPQPSSPHGGSVSVAKTKSKTTSCTSLSHHLNKTSSQLLSSSTFLNTRPLWYISTNVFQVSFAENLTQTYHIKYEGKTEGCLSRGLCSLKVAFKSWGLNIAFLLVECKNLHPCGSWMQLCTWKCLWSCPCV